MNDDPIQPSDIFPAPKPSEKSIHIAAQCWCDEETGSIEMDTRLAMAFAKRLDVNHDAIAELTERNVALAAENEERKQVLNEVRAVNNKLIGALDEIIQEMRWEESRRADIAAIAEGALASPGGRK